MNGKLTQPQIDHYIQWLRRNDYFGIKGCIYDDKSVELLDELFDLIEKISPVSKYGVRKLWFRAERGSIEDFGNMEEEIADGIYESKDDVYKSWISWFPEEIEWYEFSAVQYKEDGYRSITLQHNIVIVQDKKSFRNHKRHF